MLESRHLSRHRGGIQVFDGERCQMAAKKYSVFNGKFWESTNYINEVVETLKFDLKEGRKVIIRNNWTKKSIEPDWEYFERQIEDIKK